MSEAMNVFRENALKTRDLFSWKTRRINLTLLLVKNVANVFSVCPEYMQRKRQSVFHGNNWDRVNLFLIESLENSLIKI